jgi:hypothetical protein
LTAFEALKHPWFESVDNLTKSQKELLNKDSKQIIKRLQTFRGVSKLKKAAM